MTSIPSYMIVYQDLKQKIKERIYAPGTFLPIESELERQYLVSRTTIRKAIGILTSEGFLKVTQGKGTVVLNFSTTQKLNTISSITETLKAKGFHITSRGMLIEKILPTQEVIDQLELGKSEPVYRIQRVQCADGQPIALIVNYLKAKYVPDFESYTGQFVGLYQFIEEHYNITLKNATEKVSAITSDFTDSQILQIPIGSPILFTRRTVNIEQGPFEYSVIKLVADKYEYSMYLEGR